MKSTKIEDILADEIEETNEDEQININDVKQDELQDELRDQLESLKTELHMMKKDNKVESPPSRQKQVLNSVSKDAAEEHVAVEQNTTSTNDKELGVLEKLLKLDKNDVKQIIIVSILYVVANSAQIHEVIDNLIPYSFYSYSFIIKLVLFVLTFRILNSFEI